MKKAEAPPIAQIERSGILGKLTPNERGERKTPVYPCDRRFQRGHALTHDDLVGAGKVVRRHVEIARRRSVLFPAAVVVGAAMAGTQPALLTLVGHASQMSADAHHHQPLGLLDACAVRLRILAAAAVRHGGDLLGRAVKYEHRLAAPGDGVHFTGADARQFARSIGLGAHRGGGIHAVDERPRSGRPADRAHAAGRGYQKLPAFAIEGILIRHRLHPSNCSRVSRQIGTLVLAYSDSTISAPLSWILLAAAPRRTAMAQPP